MPYLICEDKDECVSIRLVASATNALTTEFVKAITAAIEDAEGRARGILLCGGDKFFSNGADLAWALTQSGAQMRDMFLELGRCVLKLLECPLPVVCAIKGHAIGAGMALLLACDYRYAARGRVLVGKPEILLGVPNPYYGDQLLRFVAGDFIGSDLIYSGKLISGEAAHGLGLVHGVADKPDIEALAWEQLKFLRDLAPAAFAESKRMRSGVLCARIAEQMSARVARQVEVWNSPEAQTRLRAAAARLTR